VARSKSSFRQRDLTRAAKALRAADIPIERIEITDGKLVIIPADGTPAADANLFELEAARLRKQPKGDAA
jgi:hypothetical protein